MKQFLSFSILLLSLMNQAQAQEITPAPTPEPARAATDMVSRSMVLVHGAGHGAWCWFKVLPFLRSSGYNVTAIDLGASGINPQQINDIKNISDYFQPLMKLLEALPENVKVILVAHSYGGFAVASAMERFSNKIACAVFVAASMPGPSLNASTIFQYVLRQVDQMDNIITYDDKNNPKTLTFGPIFLRKKLYNRSPIEDWTLATTLIRPHPLPNEDDLSSDVFKFTKQNYGKIRRVYVYPDEDLLIENDFQNFMLQKNPPNKILKIAGSDHMIMISKPIELSSLLLQIAQTSN